MKPRLHWMLSLLIGLGLLAGACTPAAAPAEPTAPPQPTAVPEPTADPAALRQAMLDAGYERFLTDMPGYYALKMDPFVAMLAEDPAPFVLDVRQPEEVEKDGHIPGAVLVPLRELGASLHMLPSFDTPIVSYCGSGWRCTIAITALGAMGWENVLSLKDNSFAGYRDAGYEVAPGLPPAAEHRSAASPDPVLVEVFDATLSQLPEGWGVVTPEALATELTEAPELILLDVRTQAEIDKNGAIEAENAVTLALEDLITGKAEWPTDKDAPIVSYCGSGHRSTIAMTILRSYGYSDVRSSEGRLHRLAGRRVPEGRGRAGPGRRVHGVPDRYGEVRHHRPGRRQ